MAGDLRDDATGERWILDLLALRSIPGLGDTGVFELLRVFGTPRAALDAPAEAFDAVAGPGQSIVRDEGGRRKWGGPELLVRCRKTDVRIIPIGHPEYPDSLLILPDPPTFLFVRGTASLRHPRPVTLVGARRSSPYGRRTARRLGRELAAEGCAVLSGLALGIDAEAHLGALEGGGITLAVLGSGSDRSYPAANRAIYDRIVESGLVLSELPPGSPALPHHFPRRNRILAALAAGVVVVEAGRRSGANITADHALEIGRAVMAVPGPVESPQSRGTLELIRDGAAPVANAWDILSFLDWDPISPHAPDDAGRVPPERLGRIEGRVWRALGAIPESPDSVARRLSLPPARVVAALGLLEVTGWVETAPGGRYFRTPPE